MRRSDRFWSTFRAVGSGRTLGQPTTRKAAGYGNGQKGTFCGTDFFSIEPQEKNSASRGGCRLMSFEKHTMLFLEEDMSASKRQWRQ